MKNETTASDGPDSWREALEALERERGRLQGEIHQLRTEREQLTKALIALLEDEVTLTEEEILAQIGKEKPLRELLEELRTEVVGS